MDLWLILLWTGRLILISLIAVRLWHMAHGRRFAREELTGKPSSDLPFVLYEGSFVLLSFTLVEPFFRWVGTGPFPVTAANAFFVMTLAIHEGGHAARLYQSMAFHFAAHTSISFLIGVLVFFGLFHGNLEARAYFSTVGLVFAIGVVWEYMEMYGTEYLDNQSWYHNWDMIIDIVGNTLGGLLAVLFGHFLVTGGIALW